VKPLREKRDQPEGDRPLYPPFIPDDSEPLPPDSIWAREPKVGERRTRADGTVPIVCIGRDPQVLLQPDHDWWFEAGGWIWVDEADLDRVYQDEAGDYWLRGGAA
jgi:hypothetical protein